MNNIWQHHDEQMIKLQTIYTKINKQLKNKLQEYFNRFKITSDNLYLIVDSNTKKQINEYIDEWRNENFTGYFRTFANNLYIKSRITYIEVLELLIYKAYIDQQKKEDKEENSLFYSLLNFYYLQGQEEVNKTLPKTKRKSKKNLSNDLFLLLLSMPNALGYVYKEYKDSITRYNVEQIKRQAVINIQQGKELDINSNEFLMVIKKQQSAKLNINENKISGAVDNTLIGMNNQAKIEGIKYIDSNAKIKIIAVNDEKTTKMCKSLDGQEFWVNDWNEFKRYSANQESIVKYRCKGLVLGLNLPPINDHFHWCRSTIIYVANNKKTRYNENNLDVPKMSKTVKNILGNTKLNSNVKRLFDKYLTDDNIKIDSNLNVPMRYSIKDDKIYINPNHSDFKYYDLSESLSHEIIHLIDIRNKISDKLNIDSDLRRARLQIDIDNDKYINLLNSKKYEDNMSIGDIFSAITNGKITGNYGHSINYWLADVTRVEKELSADIMSAYLTNNQDTLDIIDNIAGLKEIKEKVVKIYGKYTK